MSTSVTSEVHLSDFDLHLISEGTHYRLYEKLGAHGVGPGGANGTRFAVWAPNARRVCVVGEFNGWRADEHQLESRGNNGIWEAFVPEAKPGGLYKYLIESQYNGYRVEKADPFAFASEIRPQTASKIWNLSGYRWADGDWMSRRGETTKREHPMSVYEVHLGSWRRMPEAGNRWLTYREVAPLLADYARDNGFTHVELLPMTEHPFDGSWGYQTVGYFSPTSRFGTPDDFMFLVDTLHQAGIGVILDWVPAHFPRDLHGLGYFDGTHLYEHADPKQGIHAEWDTLVFNYGRTEVSNFLISSALFWLDRYHIDGLRIDAVASMLYLDYSRTGGDWVPNRFGGRENLEAVDFIRRLNERVYGEFPDTMTIAEESTSWPMVTRPTYLGGLGFGYKWDMGWMHDMLQYISLDPVHRRFHHERLTFRMLYAWQENFMLPLSHDEVVHGKSSLLGRMPGDDWQKFANLRLLFATQWAQPGKKLLFMGGEIAAWDEWKHDQSLPWHLLEYDRHAGIQRLVRDLNHLYRSEGSMHEMDNESDGFHWVDCNDADQSVISFMRRGHDPEDAMLLVFNFTPVPRDNYRIGVPWRGEWKERFNTNATTYGGSGMGNLGRLQTSPVAWHGQMQSLNLVVPPLAMIALQAPKKHPAGGASKRQARTTKRRSVSRSAARAGRTRRSTHPPR